MIDETFIYCNSVGECGHSGQRRCGAGGLVGPTQQLHHLPRGTSMPLACRNSECFYMQSKFGFLA
jgi:hypothetical protein